MIEEERNIARKEAEGVKAEFNDERRLLREEIA
jgi:hypothetical protein